MRITPGDVWGDHRFLPRHDQGEHEVGFQFLFGRRFVEHEISQAAIAFNAAPYYQVFYPDGRTRRSAAVRNLAGSVELDRNNVQITALKKSEQGNALIVRLQEVDGRATEVGVKVHGFRHKIRIAVGAYALKTLRFTRSRGKLSCREVNLVENL
jgi:alpha-mannosidase